VQLRTRNLAITPAKFNQLVALPQNSGKATPLCLVYSHQSVGQSVCQWVCVTLSPSPSRWLRCSALVTVIRRPRVPTATYSQSVRLSVCPSDGLRCSALFYSSFSSVTWRWCCRRCSRWQL